MLVPELFNDSMFDDFFQDMGFPFYNDHDMRMAEKKLYGRRGKNLMKTDIKENEQGYELEMDLPGFKKEDVQVLLENGYLTIRAEKGLQEDDQEKKS